MPSSGDVARANVGGMPCPYCGGTKWSAPLGRSPLTPDVLVLGRLDDVGRPTLDDGVHVYAFACVACGYVRLFTPDHFEPQQD